MEPKRLTMEALQAAVEKLKNDGLYNYPAHFHYPQGAYFSEDRKYRYLLWRIWSPGKPLVLFIGLNPSTANETENDPTIRRVISFASTWGYGGVFMANLFAYVTPKPEVLKQVEDPLGDNDKVLSEVISRCKMVVAAWGAFDVFGRDKKVLAMINNPHALVINKDGSPRHPLYVKRNVVPIPYKANG